jgi:ketosteroid isomerase-like protein
MSDALTRDERSRLRELEDQRDIQEVVTRYGDGIRRKDPGLIASCFDDDGVFHQGDDRALRGRDAIIQFYENKASSGVSPASTFSEWVASTPFISNFAITLDGDTAHCTSMCLAVHTGYKEGVGSVIVRGTEYIDDLVRTKSGWKIRERRHPAMWAFEVAGTPFDRDVTGGT